MNRLHFLWKKMASLAVFAGFATGIVLVSASCEDGGKATSALTARAMHAIGDELVQNGDFSSGSTGWYLGRWGAPCSGYVTNGHYVVDVSAAGTEWWNAQFHQVGINLEQGKRYKLTFDAWKGPENPGTQKMQINAGEDGDDYTGYMSVAIQDITLTTTSTRYSFTFDMLEPTDAAARIEFNCGLYAGTYHLDNVSLQEVGMDTEDSDTGTDDTDAYQPQSPYILHPELNIDFVRDIATFRSRGRDDVNGGFYTSLDRAGNPTTENIKSMCGQSRIAYAFVRAFMLTGDTAYLDNARHALAFLYEHAYNNGWYFATDIYGNYISHWGHNDWWSFQQHYAMVGITAMVEATAGGNMNWNDGQSSDATWLQTGLDNLNNHLWDSTAGVEGYFGHASTDWSSKWDKGFTPTADAITTHAALLDLMFDDPQFETRLLALAHNLVDHMAGSMSTSALGWPEVYDAYWNVDSTMTTTDVGHVYKVAWILERIYLRHPEYPEFREAAKAMMWDMWENGGYDHVNGGPFSQLQWNTGVISNTNKDHWMLEQCVTSGLINSYVADNQTDRNIYLETADESMRFYMEHQVDQQYGDVFDKITADGSSVVAVLKGGLFNGGYHAIELGYYTYLYSSLYYHRQPVSLYYNIPPAGSERTIRLTPVAIEDDLLKILSVEANGTAVTTFNADTRELTVPAGANGVYKVTFGFDAQVTCGDGVCNGDETCDSCSQDCGECISCGDGVCNGDETCDSCSIDCGECISCGDGVCNGDETCDSCSIDCGECQTHNCTCPGGCDAIVAASYPFSVNGTGDTCYFFENAGSYINSWNNQEVNINGTDITNVWMGSSNYPAALDGGYYIYYKGNFPWSHIEVK
jgi:mannose/cellobiose epimerase-like protein (N-acyl-D-glucosamine 2-epimerase family)